MSNFEKYVCVEDLIVGDSAPELSEITSLGLLRRLDFYMVLQDVYIIWLAVFDGHRDCCNYHRISGIEFFKITTESLEKLIVASKGGQALSAFQLELEVPADVKKGYGLEPDYYTCELRRISRSDTQNTTPTIDIAVNQPSSNRDIFNKLETVCTPGDIYDERDYVGWANSELDNAGWENFELGYVGWKTKVANNLDWEKIQENDLVSIMERNILQLWVDRDQVEMILKKSDEGKSLTIMQGKLGGEGQPPAAQQTAENRVEQKVDQKDQKGERVDGHKGMAKTLNVVERSVKNYARRYKTYPIYTDPSNGHVFGYTNELLLWKEKHDGEVNKRRRDRQRKRSK